MDSSNDSSTHDKAMETLCFVCGYVMKKDDRFYLVGEWSDFLAKALRCSEVFELPGITPTKFCFGCYTNLGHIESGRSVKTYKTMEDWGECGPDYNACKRFSSSQRKHPGRKKKVHSLLFLTSTPIFIYDKITMISTPGDGEW